jgi:predicted PurR-regulated permease PerM
VNDTAVRRVWVVPGFTAILVTVLLLWLAGSVADLLLLLFLGLLLAVYLSAVTDLLAARTGMPRGGAPAPVLARRHRVLAHSAGRRADT